MLVAAGGHTSFEGRDLHDLSVTNPYERVIDLVGKEVASVLDKDSIFPVLAFGDAGSVEHESGCVHVGDASGFDGVRDLYRRFVSDKRVVKSGPTSFAGVVRYGIDHVIRNRNRFHTLLIITDGQINDQQEEAQPDGSWKKVHPTVEALLEASHYPMEVLIVGVGDGPWESMEALDDKLASCAKSSKFDYRVDCVQFVPFTRYMRTTDASTLQRFTVDCLQEVPQLKEWMDSNSKLGPQARAAPIYPPPVAWVPEAAVATAPL
jgi:E3 ubiquitin-protein ligase RGLG